MQWIHCKDGFSVVLHVHFESHNTHLRLFSSVFIKVKGSNSLSVFEQECKSQHSLQYKLWKPEAYSHCCPLYPFFCLVLALLGVWHNYKWFVWASTQAPAPMDQMLLSMENRGLLVSVPLTQCGETKGHDRCQDRGPDLCLSSRPSAVIHAGIHMSQCHLSEYMTFMNKTLECYNNVSQFIQIQGSRFYFNLVINSIFILIV